VVRLPLETALFLRYGTFNHKKGDSLMTQKPQDMNTLTFEAALKELEDIVRLLERGETTLDQSIGTYERGMALKAFCEKKLKESQLKVEKIVENGSGNITTAPVSFGE
jgi:exodeoxyribonuclease VII small subunit